MSFDHWHLTVTVSGRCQLRTAGLG